ncbi:MAG: hypothetical protein D6743_08840, partial [Calditrichaeota bacterium]
MECTTHTADVEELKPTRKDAQESDATYQQELLKVSKNAGLGGGTIVLGILLNYAGTVLATRVIGADAWGVFFLAQTILVNMVLFATLGLNQGALRYVALYQGRNDLARLKGTVLYCLKRVLVPGVVMTLLIFALAPAIADGVFKQPELNFALRMLILALPFWTATEVMTASLQGLRLIGPSTMVRYGVQPGLRLVLLALLFAVGLRLAGVVLATVLSMTLATGYAYWKLRQVSRGFWPETEPVFE